MDSRTKFTIALVLVTCMSASTALKGRTDDRVAQLASAGRLWATIDYFHPFLAWKPIDWDQALVAALPELEAASTRHEFAAAIDSMLAPLGDPATHVIVPAENTRGGLGFTSVELRSDGILVATTGVVPGDPLESAVQLVKLLPSARTVLLDLRGGAAHAWLLYPGLFTTRALVLPAFRTRAKSGVHPDRGGWASPYFGATLIRDSLVVPPAENSRDIPVVFLVEDDRQVPHFAPALQDHGTGYIVSARPLTGSALVTSVGGLTTDIPVLDGITVRMRSAELAHADGTTGMCADLVVPERPFDAAIAFAQRPTRGECRRPSIPRPTLQQINRRHATAALPSREYRLLAVFRIWGVFEYLFPYRELINDDWNAVLSHAVRQVSSATEAVGYHLAVSEMASKVHDTHAAVSSPTLTAHWGVASPGVAVRPIEGQPVVVAALEGTGAQVGDVITAIDGEPVAKRMAALSPYISASTPQSLARDAIDRLLRGPDKTTVTVTVRGAGGAMRMVPLLRTTEAEAKLTAAMRREPIRILEQNVGYIDLRQITVGEVDGAFEKLRATKGIIFDMRGYPRNTSHRVAHWIATAQEILAARFRRRITLSPRSTTTEETATPLRLALDPQQHYAGRTVMLIDDRAQSQSEHTGMVLKAAGGTTFVGTATAGANGDGTAFYVPGGLYIGLTGQGVWHADGRQLQRVGLIPDVVVAPTLRGIREGRDEVLERGLAVLAGK